MVACALLGAATAPSSIATTATSNVFIQAPWNAADGGVSQLSSYPWQRLPPTQFFPIGQCKATPVRTSPEPAQNRGFPGPMQLLRANLSQ